MFSNDTYARSVCGRWIRANQLLYPTATIWAQGVCREGVLEYGRSETKCAFGVAARTIS